MIKEFIAHIDEVLTTHKCKYSIVENTKGTPSVYFDIDNDVNLGRITLWDDGSCCMEIVNVESERNLFIERFDSHGLTELSDKLGVFLRIMCSDNNPINNG